MANLRGRQAGVAGFETRRRRGLFARWWVWLLIGLVLSLAPWPASVADAVYVNGTHPLYSRLTAPLHDAVPLSLAAALAMVFLIVALLGLVSGRGGRRAAFGFLGWWLAVMALSFPLVFGLGYRSTPLEARLRLPEAAPGSVATQDVAAAAELVLAALQESASTRERVASGINADPVQAASRCLAGYLESRELPGGALPSLVKSVPAGSLMSLGFTGTLVPWLLEPHVDPALPPASHLSVALHELVHAAGYAREAEAEALGLLAGLECGDPRVRYAAALAAANALANALAGPTAADFRSRWPDVAVADAAALAEAVASHRWAFAAEPLSRVYDTYLVSQGTASGIGDYARATTILVRALLSQPDQPGS